MARDRCPDCGASLVVAIPARHAFVGSPTDAPGRPISGASAPPILRCPDCDRYWVPHGGRLDPI
jgi:rRNA maturation protein Nop10